MSNHMLPFDIVYNDENGNPYECTQLEGCLGSAVRRKAYDENGVLKEPRWCHRHFNFGYRDDE